MWTSKKHRLLLWEIIIQYLTTIGTKKIFGKDPHYNFSKGELDVKIQLQSTSVDFKHFVKPTINQVERFRNKHRTFAVKVKLMVSLKLKIVNATD